MLLHSELQSVQRLRVSSVSNSQEQASIGSVSVRSALVNAYNLRVAMEEWDQRMFLIRLMCMRFAICLGLLLRHSLL